MTTWLQHVKKVHASGSTSFKESLKRASASWKKTKGKAAAPKKGRRKQGAAASSTDEPAPVEAKPKRRRKKKAMPKIRPGSLKNIDSVNL